MKEEGLQGVNKPKRTPSHPTKSHCVMAKEGDTYKFIRFGQQGVEGAGKNPKTEKEKARRKSYYARHNAQDAKPDIMSARYWSHRVKWQMILNGKTMGKVKATTQKKEPTPKLTLQGQGKRSKPNHGRKKLRGQGKG